MKAVLLMLKIFIFLSLVLHVITFVQYDNLHSGIWAIMIMIVLTNWEGVSK